MTDFTLNHARVILEILKERSILVSKEIDNVFYAESDYTAPPVLPNDLKWGRFDQNKAISGRDEHFWLKFSVNVPDYLNEWQARIEISTGHRGGWDVLNPQMLVFVNGEVTQGLDVNHREIYLKKGINDIIIYAYKGMIDSEFKVSVFYKEIDLDTLKLYYDLLTAKSALETLKEHSPSYAQLSAKVKQAINLVDVNSFNTSFYESVKKASAYFDENIFNEKGINQLATVSFVGHTHIDVAWLWTLAQTSEKAQRSVSTVIKLMEKYPDYKFFLSQPVLYNYVKNNLPNLYEKIKEQIIKGNWEAEGSMWVEADCNLSSGESLIRQILYGKKFFKEEFNQDNNILWLPDAFGFSPALPQILKKCNIDTFITSKLSWNETNKYPHDLFMWRGIDGSEILTNFITARDATMPFEDDKHTRYNGYTTPSYVMGAWQRFQDKNYSDEVIVPFGYGDGGGSANEEMLEILERTQKGLPSFPKTKCTSIKEYAKNVQENFKNACKSLGEVPKWVGELYLELHRGTFTTMSEIKKQNRFCEFLYQKAEQLSIIGKEIFNEKYPKEDLEKGWKNVLLNQFHDILPGSSIKEVYDDAFSLYDEARTLGNSICNDKLLSIAKNVSANDGVLVYNANSFIVSDYVEYLGEMIFAENIPAMGWKVIKPINEELLVVANENFLENEFFNVKFDKQGNVISIFDKKNNREIVENNKFFNEIVAYENIPYCYDAWEISEYYKDKYKKITDSDSVKVEKHKNFAELVVTRKFSNSKIIQRTRLYNNIDRIDFYLEIDWNEQKTLIKTLFPMNIHSDEATYDIQFGSITRPTHSNTSWEKAKFEVCGHKWVDLSEDEYGISLINNSKYGFSCEENQLKMTLLTSPKYPNPEADMGKHEIAYSITTHTNHVRSGKIVQEAYKFNQPLQAVKVLGAGKVSNEFSLLNISSNTVIAETLKQAEYSDAVILRTYQSANATENIKVKLNINAKKCFLCDMLENNLEELKLQNNEIELTIKPFEVVTLKYIV